MMKCFVNTVMLEYECNDSVFKNIFETLDSEYEDQEFSQESSFCHESFSCLDDV